MKAKRTEVIVPLTPRDQIKRLRLAITEAELEGLAKADMLLRLTWRDESHLKRDQSIGLDEISFADGEMKFLGVKVVVGGIATSTLDRSAPINA